MVTEAISAPIYAPLADRYGRRPVFILLVFLWGVFALAFGYASGPWEVVLFRAALGLLAGAGVLSRTMTGELCDKTNRIKGFALFSPAFTIGVTIAYVDRGGALLTPDLLLAVSCHGQCQVCSPSRGCCSRNIPTSCRRLLLDSLGLPLLVWDIYCYQR